VTSYFNCTESDDPFANITEIFSKEETKLDFEKNNANVFVSLQTKQREKKNIIDKIIYCQVNFTIVHILVTVVQNIL